MGAHSLLMDHETSEYVQFRCATCNAIINFVKPAFGEPAAAPVDGGWSPPDNPDQWLGACQ